MASGDDRHAGATMLLKQAAEEAREHAGEDDDEDEDLDLLVPFNTGQPVSSDHVDSNHTGEMRDDTRPLKRRKLELPRTAGNSASQSAPEYSEDDVVRNASKEVIVPETWTGYERLFDGFEVFLRSEKMLNAPTQNVADLLPRLPADLPDWTAKWIMFYCDSINIRNGTEKHPSIHVASYSHATKMRSAITHTFTRIFRLPNHWIEHPQYPGFFTGNPAASQVMKQYMGALRRRKARSGEKTTSAKAITEAVLCRLWECNEDVRKAAAAAAAQAETEVGAEASTSCAQPRKRKRKTTGRKKTSKLPETTETTDDQAEAQPQHSSDWGGPATRTMLHCAYVLSMLCLLRYEEVLGLCWDNISFITTPDGKFMVEIRLNTRKTHQNGDIKPFFLQENFTQPHICPVLAVGNWWGMSKALGLQRYGYVFRKRILGGTNDRVSYRAEDKLSNESFLSCFRNNLLDIDVDPRGYGTHSFRRGGAQYLHVIKGWSIATVSKWGGWTHDFDGPGTIFKYLVSWVDEAVII